MTNFVLSTLQDELAILQQENAQLKSTLEATKNVDDDKKESQNSENATYMMSVSEARQRRQGRVEARRLKARVLFQEGLSIPEIAKKLNKSERTVKTYLNGRVQKWLNLR